MALRTTQSIGMLLLAIWLILTGLFGLLGMGFPNSGFLLAALALIAGIAILVGR